MLVERLTLRKTSLVNPICWVIRDKQQTQPGPDWTNFLISYIHMVLVCMLSRFSHVQLCVTPWTVAHQTPLSMGFSRQEYWSGLPCPPPGDLPNPGIEPASLASPTLSGRFFTTSATWEAHTYGTHIFIYFTVIYIFPIISVSYSCLDSPQKGKLKDLGAWNTFILIV